MDYKEYNDKLFSRWAPIYDGFELILSGIRKKMVRQINPVNKSVLDVATGTGSLAIALSSKAKKVVGIDLSSQMLAVAKKKTVNDNVTLLLMDATDMKFEDDEFDIITISLGLHDMPREIRDAVLTETKRVLKSDGQLFILEYDSSRNKQFNWISTNLINTFESKYYLQFIQTDLKDYLKSFDFKIKGKTSHLFGHLQLISLTK
ncbi:MAG: methyltransferase domain-containing protein [Flavobacteriales bacterium]|nr:methyltransferase domain-containing protein [Flavobacteriales bacterium]